MGIFGGSKKRPFDKHIREATKRGVPVDGALGVASSMEGGHWQTLVVWPDRVDVHTSKKAGALFGSGAGVDSYPVGSVSSAGVRQSGIWSILTLTGSNFEVVFKGTADVVPLIRDQIMRAKAAA